ncbi:uncharacterized protein LOC108599288 isoform X2 [Drosophila busckii]|uniref:uncharacterized protein LOC108599288 isoform X2 n=1 Tax=Drosophila busckii TaxID=30019 RepID=UPI00083F4354|nr:uncharacterized protein LOC108599288 isoform X2 [Drosophila busckii]
MLQYNRGRAESPSCKQLLYISTCIAGFDLCHALYFTFLAIRSLTLEVNYVAVLGLLGSMIWVVFVVLLMDRQVLVECWLVFSLIGILLDIILLIYTIITTEHKRLPQIMQFVLLGLAISIEWCCIFIVYKYCNTMADSCNGSQIEIRNSLLIHRRHIQEHDRELYRKLQEEEKKGERRSERQVTINESGEESDKPEKKKRKGFYNLRLPRGGRHDKAEL